MDKIWNVLFPVLGAKEDDLGAWEQPLGQM